MRDGVDLRAVVIALLGAGVASETHARSWFVLTQRLPAIAPSAERQCLIGISSCYSDTTRRGFEMGISTKRRHIQLLRVRSSLLRSPASASPLPRLMIRRAVLVALVGGALAACARTGLREPLRVNLVGLESLPGEGMEARFLARIR